MRVEPTILGEDFFFNTKGKKIVVSRWDGVWFCIRKNWVLIVLLLKWRKMCHEKREAKICIWE